MRPTTKDLARAAGVSLATVDRVLNGRAGVRIDTVERVNAAIARIGFVRNASAASLARGRPLRVLFLLPRRGGAFLAAIEARVADTAAALAADMVDVETRRIDAADPHAVARSLAMVEPQAVDAAIVMAPETPPARDALLRLQARGVAVVAMGAAYGAHPALATIGFDERAAGATAARLMGRFLCEGSRRVIVLGDTLANRAEVDRRLGFDRLVAAAYPLLRPTPTLEAHGDPERAARILAAAASEGRPAGVYLLSSEAEIAMAAVEATFGAPPERARPVVVAHERTPATERGLRSGALAAVIARDPGHLVRSAVRRARARVEGRAHFADQERIRVEILLAENL